MNIDPLVHPSLITTTKTPNDLAYESLKNAYNLDIKIDLDAPTSRRCVCGVRLNDSGITNKKGVSSHIHSAEHVFNAGGPGIQYWTRPKGEILTLHEYVARTWPEDEP